MVGLSSQGCDNLVKTLGMKRFHPCSNLVTDFDIVTTQGMKLCCTRLSQGCNNLDIFVWDAIPLILVLTGEHLVHW